MYCKFYILYFKDYVTVSREQLDGPAVSVVRVQLRKLSDDRKSRSLDR
jgi:hypothetical protein